MGAASPRAPPRGRGAGARPPRGRAGRSARDLRCRRPPDLPPPPPRRNGRGSGSRPGSASGTPPRPRAPHDHEWARPVRARGEARCSCPRRSVPSAPPAHRGGWRGPRRGGSPDRGRARTRPRGRRVPAGARPGDASGGAPAGRFRLQRRRPAESTRALQASAPLRRAPPAPPSPSTAAARGPPARRVVPQGAAAPAHGRTPSPGTRAAIRRSPRGHPPAPLRGRPPAGSAPPGAPRPPPWWPSPR